jgi:chromosome segregation protein
VEHLYFKRIDMHGFKSFAEPVSVDFHKGITCIVGPNGSGKSNISDAIRWVLGEQSPKMLRGGKMEEVIFSGTENRKSRGMAEVTLTLDNQKGILPIDYTEVSITRRMYRSGESEYSINNHPCRLKDIRELIMDTGIGVDGYSLIGQGKISDIVGNKPESRREIFEEAAGIVKYKSKKAEAEKKLESTNYNLERVNDIVFEIESRIDGLKSDSKNAREFLDLRERLKSIEINSTLKNIEALELKNEYIKDDLQETCTMIDENKDIKVAIDEDIKDNQEQNEEMDAIGIKARDELLEQVENINILTNKNQLNMEKIQAFDNDIIRINEENENIFEKINKEEIELKHYLSKEVSIKEKLSKSGEVLQKYQDDYQEIQSSIRLEGIQLEDNKNKIYQLHNESLRNNSEISSYNNLAATFVKRKEQINAEREIINSQQESLVINQNILKTSKEKINKELLIIEQNKLSESNELEKIKENESKEIIHLDKIRQQISDKASRKRLIEEMENSYEGYNNAVKYIMKSKSEHPGIFGTVADLIQVPSGYEQALEAALAASVQNIVCDTDNSAKQAINALKENKAGRLTFLPINSIKSGATTISNDIKSAIGYLGFASDKITFDKKYIGIFQYLLGRVILVDNIDNAIKMSKFPSQGLRFVTLEGEIINSSGSITGGAVKAHGPGLLERKGEIKNLETELADLRSQENSLISTISNIKEGIKSLIISIDEIGNKIHELKIKQSSNESEITQNESQIIGITQNLSRMSSEIDQIDNELKIADIQIKKLELSSKDSREEALSIENHVDEANEQFAVLKAKGDVALETLTNKRLEMATLESELVNLEAIIRKASIIVQDLKSENSLKEDLIKVINIKRDELSIENSEMDIELGKLQFQKSEIEDLLKNCVTKKELIVNYLKEIHIKRENIIEIIANYQDEKFQLDLKLAKNEAQIDAFKDKLWDEFEISYIQAIDFKKTEFVMAAAQREIKEIKGRIKELGEINIGAIKEYETTKERYDFLTTQRKDLLDGILSLKKIIEEMDKTIKSNFKESFEKIADNFQSAFTELFGGGSAKLRLEDESRPLESGIEIIAQPPGKKLQNINLLSGGEKTMTAIALMFAVLKAKPTPFCILDEVEAALDDSNIKRFAEYLKNFKEIQFALVTHQKATMEYADILYGVTMPERGVSKILSLKLGNIED